MSGSRHVRPGRALTHQLLLPGKVRLARFLEWLLDTILDAVVPYRLLARFPLHRARVSRAFYFDYVMNQKLQRVQLLHKLRAAGVIKPRCVKAWWSRGLRNFGDELTGFILAGVAGLDCVFDQGKDFVAVGSVVRHANSNSLVWGSGIIKQSERISSRPTCLAVRGPLTRSHVLSQGLNCPEIYGDPAMLIPLFFRPRITQPECPALVVPHFKHDSLLYKLSGLDYLDIRVANIADIEAVINKICSARTVLTSSLHVFIICVAYHVPVTVFQLEGVSIGGDNVKFSDFCLGVGLEPVPIHTIPRLTEDTARELIERRGVHMAQWSPEPLLRALYGVYPTPYLAGLLRNIDKNAAIAAG